MKAFSAVAILFVMLAVAWSQTRVDLRSQSKNINFSAADSTRTTKTGVGLAAQCAVGETFFRTDAPDGQNLYGCTAANVWTALGKSDLPVATGNANKILSTDGAIADWRSLGGDVAGPPEQLSVTAIQGHPVAPISPAAGQALIWDDTSGRWIPGIGTAQMPPVVGNASRVLSTDGNQFEWRSIAGDVTGMPEQLAVTGIQGRAIAPDVPLSGQALIWDSATNRWVPGVPGTVGLSSNLGDLRVSRFNDTQLLIGEVCSTTIPCNVRIGSTIHSFRNSYLVNLASGTGTAFMYIDEAGNLTVGHNLTLTCSTSCINASGSTAFPANSIPLASWTATNGVWDISGGSEYRAFLTQNVLVAGSGIVITNNSASSEISVDSAGLTTPGGNNVFTGDNDFSAARSTRPVKTGTALPVTCAVGELFFKTDAAPGQNLYTCSATDQWTAPTAPNGTSVLTVATYADISPCTSANAGMTLLPPADGYYLQHCNGVIWEYWHGDHMATPPPPAGSWAWLNQGPATLNDDSGAVVLTSPGGGYGINVRGALRPLPATPYTITAELSIQLTNNMSTDAHAGLLLRDSTAGKLIAFGLYRALSLAANAVIWKLDGVNGPSVTQSAFVFSATANLFLRVKDDGTDRSFGISSDGRHFVEILKESHSEHMIPDEVGLYCDPENLNGCSVTLLSWQEGS